MSFLFLTILRSPATDSSIILLQTSVRNILTLEVLAFSSKPDLQMLGPGHCLLFSVTFRCERQEITKPPGLVCFVTFSFFGFLVYILGIIGLVSQYHSQVIGKTSSRNALLSASAYPLNTQSVVRVSATKNDDAELSTSFRDRYTVSSNYPQFMTRNIL